MSKSTEKVDKRLRAEMKRRRKGKGEEDEKKGGEGYQSEKTRRKLRIEKIHTSVSDPDSWVFWIRIRGLKGIVS